MGRGGAYEVSQGKWLISPCKRFPQHEKINEIQCSQNQCCMYRSVTLWTSMQDQTKSIKNVNIYCCFWIPHWNQEHSEYTQKLYYYIWFHKGSEHIPYYNLQKSTLQKFKILNIKKVQLQKQAWNCNQWLLWISVCENNMGTSQIQSKQKVLFVRTAGFGH